jgi:hypothetical protein
MVIAAVASPYNFNSNEAPMTNRQSSVILPRTFMGVYRTTLICMCFSIHVAAKEPSNPDSVLYKQKVSRDDQFFRKMFAPRRGMLAIKKDSVTFTTKRQRSSWLNFSLSYDEIEYVKRVFWTPNRTKIKAKNGETYRLFTYKRGKIIKFIRAKL